MTRGGRGGGRCRSPSVGTPGSPPVLLPRLVPVPVSSHPSAGASPPPSCSRRFPAERGRRGDRPRPPPTARDRGDRPPPARGCSNQVTREQTGPGTDSAAVWHRPPRPEPSRESGEGTGPCGISQGRRLPGAGRAVQGHLPARGVGSAMCDSLSGAQRGREATVSPSLGGVFGAGVGKGLLHCLPKWK